MATKNSRKTECPVTKSGFREEAKDIPVAINGTNLTAIVKEFSTGSFGWYLNGKTSIMVGETRCEVQIGMNLTVVNSKDAAE